MVALVKAYATGLAATVIAAHRIDERIQSIGIVASNSTSPRALVSRPPVQKREEALLRHLSSKVELLLSYMEQLGGIYILYHSILIKPQPIEGGLFFEILISYTAGMI